VEFKWCFHDNDYDSQVASPSTASSSSCHRRRRISILAYDLDPTAVKACKDRIANHPAFDKALPSRIHIVVRQNNFLTLTVNNIVVDAAVTATTEATADDKEEREIDNNNPKLTPPRLIFLGGPPYASGTGQEEKRKNVTQNNESGDGGDTKNNVVDLTPSCSTSINSKSRELDLPARFVTHCLGNLGGDAVVFLVPKRCASEHIIKGIQKDIVLKQQQQFQLQNSTLARQPLSVVANNDDDGGKTIKEKTEKWHCETKELDKSLFDFRGKKVSQPSVCQCWHRQ